MQRTVMPAGRFRSEALAPGVTLLGFHPGGKDGPNGEVLAAVPGGQVWTDVFLLGDRASPFQMLLPDIRLPANQHWPLHWHDCWTVVVIVEGNCLVGDWWMAPGDVFIAEPSIEYGPLVIGPQGCRMFEIFAKLHLSRGGYAPEYRDHPTLQGTQSVFSERSALNRRNEGRHVMPTATDGFTKSRLTPGARWELGAPTDPDRGVVQDLRLSAGQKLPAREYPDWHGLVVMAGEVRVEGRAAGVDHLIVIEPGARLPPLEAGAQGAQLLELARRAG